MMTPAGFEHGRIVMNISGPLHLYLKQNPLGIVAGAETGFQIARNPDTVRAPDVAFVRAQRVPSSPVPGYFEGPPDLAVEVLSPGDRASEVLAKVGDWLDAGCRSVWVVDPRTRTVSVYRGPSQVIILHDSELISDEELLPGFRVRVAELFPA